MGGLFLVSVSKKQCVASKIDTAVFIQSTRIQPSNSSAEQMRNIAIGFTQLLPQAQRPSLSRVRKGTSQGVQRNWAFGGCTGLRKVSFVLNTARSSSGGKRVACNGKKKVLRLQASGCGQMSCLDGIGGNLRCAFLVTAHV